MGGSFCKITIYIKTYVFGNSRRDELEVTLSDFNKWDGCSVSILDNFNITITQPTNLRNPIFNEPSISSNMLNPYRINLSRDKPLKLSFQPTGIINLVKACGSISPSSGQQGLILTYVMSIVINADEGPNTLSDNALSWYYINQRLTPTSINTRTTSSGNLNYNYKDNTVNDINNVTLVPISLSSNTCILDITVNPDLSVSFNNSRCPNVNSVIYKDNALEVTSKVNIGRISCVTNITGSSLTVPSMLSCVLSRSNDNALLIRFVTEGNNITFVDDNITAKYAVISTLVRDGPLLLSLMVYAW